MIFLREYLKLPQMLFHEKIWSYPSQMNQSSFQALNRFLLPSLIDRKLILKYPFLVAKDDCDNIGDFTEFLFFLVFWDIFGQE